MRPFFLSALGFSLFCVSATISASETLEVELRNKLSAMPADYEPRTEHFNSDGEPTFINRLINQSSPYLLQHAHNPVDWRAWGPSAMEEAKAKDLPIFLSIGYSTCHWCHVMERESFENVEIANVLNANFIPIKVDREQRPDIDQIYMAAVQLTTGRGGWPLSAFLTPAGEPFFSGTYFPPDNFQQLLLNGARGWNNNRLDIDIYANDVSRAVRSYLSSVEDAAELTEPALAMAVEEMLSTFEELEGGFSEAPKFPNEPIQSLLMQIARDGGPQSLEALQAVEFTLDAIQRGGITDQIGGGFHRYSTDNSWLVPHFEKMLYNQAQLGKLYAEAYELTGRKDFKRTAKHTFDYVLREMTSPTGTFYSATDADNVSAEGEMEEGDFFIWSPEQMEAALSPADYATANRIFSLSAAGNFEGRTILTLPAATSAEDLAFVDRISPTLRAQRAKRNPPLRDDKVIVSWNGQLIEALATAGYILGEQAYIEAAALAANSLFETNWDAKSGELKRIQFRGIADKLAGQLDDYASLAIASIKLYDVTLDEKWLARSGALVSTMKTNFIDEDSSFFMTASLSDTTSFTRPKEFYDGAQPSSNSLALGALVALYQRTGQPMLRRYAFETWTRLSGNALNSARSHPVALLHGLKLNHDTHNSVAFAANGNVLVEASRNQQDVSVRAFVREGWHVNANKPLQSDYIPTVLGGGDLKSITYPQPRIYTPSFTDEGLSVYDGTIVFTAKLENVMASQASLQIQTCSDEICLPPETVRLLIPAAEK